MSVYQVLGEQNPLKSKTGEGVAGKHMVSTEPWRVGIVVMTKGGA